MKKKIVFITSGIGIGGAEKQLAILARGLMARQYQVTIISLSTDAKNDILPDFQTLTTIQYDFETGRKLPHSILGLRSILYENNPDIVQGWMYGGNIAASLASIGICRRVYHAVRASNMDSARYGLQIWANAILSYTSQAIVANSQSGFDFHISRGFSQKRMHLIPNGIDNETFRPDRSSRKNIRRELKIGSNEFVVSYVARVDPMKGHHVVAAAAKICPEIKFIFAGLGTDRMLLPKNVIGLGVRKDMPSILNGSDWVISWSNHGEGFPNVIGEAMACGVPVIANNVGDSWLLLNDTGVKSTASGPDELARNLKAIAFKHLSRGRKSDLVKRIGDNFSVKRMINAYSSLYQLTDEVL